MKKLLFLIIFVGFSVGCSAKWHEHDAVYKNFDHMFFSWCGYKNTTEQDWRNSESQGWWGEEIPYIKKNAKKAAP